MRRKRKDIIMNDHYRLETVVSFTPLLSSIHETMYGKRMQNLILNTGRMWTTKSFWIQTKICFAHLKLMVQQRWHVMSATIFVTILLYITQSHDSRKFYSPMKFEWNVFVK